MASATNASPIRLSKSGATYFNGPSVGRARSGRVGLITSYAGTAKLCCESLVEMTGFEPATSGLQNQRSPY